MSLKPDKIKKDFPIFKQNQELVYLDNAATSQKPDSVIKAIEEFYRSENSNVGRGIYELANKSSQRYREARNCIAEFIGSDINEVVFLRGCTEAMNLISSGLDVEGRIAVPEMAHHSEQLPWRKEFGDRKVDYLPTKNGKVNVDRAKKLIDSETSVVSVSHVSNVFGTIQPIKQLVELAHENDAYFVLDAAQSIPHMQVDLKDLEVDFAAFSGHKMLGPMGTGVLYGKTKALEQLENYQVGGGMVRSVTKHEVEFESHPERFEAGTPNVAGAVGMAEAASYLMDIDRSKVRKHDQKLSDFAREQLSRFKGVKVVSPEGSMITSFHCDFAHPHDVGEILNQNNIAVRAGKHCAQPLMEEMEISGTVRASPYLYNTEKDVERLVKAVKEAREVFE